VTTKDLDSLEKSYQKFSHIIDGYADVLESLNLENSDSEVDKVVKFILDKNILVRQLNIALSHLTNSTSESFRQSMSSFKSVKNGHYTRTEFGTNALIMKNWEELTKSVPINDPEKCIKDFSNIRKSDGKLNLKKRNVLGCFLGQNLKAIRHAANIFKHSCKMINPGNAGKFSKEEDQIILEEASKSGGSLETWKNLARILGRTDRCDWVNIKRRYMRLTDSFHRGKWKLTEDETLIEALFQEKKVSDIRTIESIDFNDFKRVTNKLNRPCDSLCDRWNCTLKPVLLSHHYGTLHKPWRIDFFNYVIEKKAVGEQDLDYAELKILFPEQTSRSLHTSLVRFAPKIGTPEKPLFQRIKEELHNCKDPLESERVKAFREEIVIIYDRVINGDK